MVSSYSRSLSGSGKKRVVNRIGSVLSPSMIVVVIMLLLATSALPSTPRVEAAASTTKSSPVDADHTNRNSGGSTNRNSGGRSNRRIEKGANKNKLHRQKNSMVQLPPIIREEDLPIDEPQQKWQSLNQDVEFIPADGLDPRIVKRFLEQEEAVNEGYFSGGGMEKIYNVQPFAYGVDEYDEYQQAWRLLGVRYSFAFCIT